MSRASPTDEANVYSAAIAAEQRATNTFRLLSSAATTNETLITANPNTLFTITGTNNKTSSVFLKIYNKATTPVAGTDTPRKTLRLAPQANFAFSFRDAFSAGLGIALTGAAADSDTTALVAGDITCMNIDYR